MGGPQAKTVAIVQSSFIPWKGYFDLINSVDEFVFLDDVQFTKRDWRSRNYINSLNGRLLLTIPIQVKGRRFQKIYDAEISGNEWREKHWKSIQNSYQKAPYYSDITEILKPIFFNEDLFLLHDFNKEIVKAVCKYLGIKTKFHESCEIRASGVKSTKLIQICKELNAKKYLSGPSAASYIDVAAFQSSGVEIEYIDYSKYKKHPNIHREFFHNVSIIDTICHLGSNTINLMS